MKAREPRPSDALRQWLVEHIDDTARWRTDKAEQYPDDIRNVHSAQALRDAAALLRAMDEDDLPPSFHALERLGEAIVSPTWWEAYPWGPEASRAASRFGFDQAYLSVTGSEVGELLEMIYRGVLEDEADHVSDMSEQELDDREPLITILRDEGVMRSNVENRDARLLEVLTELRDLLNERLPA
jgi:hypothetical protein